MTSKELKTVVHKHEMQRLELKESFGTACINSHQIRDASA